MKHSTGKNNHTGAPYERRLEKQRARIKELEELTEDQAQQICALEDEINDLRNEEEA